jgi:hypothetical protein
MAKLAIGTERRGTTLTVEDVGLAHKGEAVDLALQTKEAGYLILKMSPAGIRKMRSLCDRALPHKAITASSPRQPT